MNEVQRATVFFFVFTVLVGAGSAPFYNRQIGSGIMAGLVVYALAFVGFVSVQWLVYGVDGIRKSIDQLTGRAG